MLTLSFTVNPVQRIILTPAVRRDNLYAYNDMTRPPWRPMRISVVAVPLVRWRYLTCQTNCRPSWGSNPALTGSLSHESWITSHTIQRTTHCATGAGHHLLGTSLPLSTSRHSQSAEFGSPLIILTPTHNPPPSHHTLHLCSGFMRLPRGQLKERAKSSELESGPRMRIGPGACTEDMI